MRKICVFTFVVLLLAGHGAAYAVPFSVEVLPPSPREGLPGEFSTLVFSVRNAGDNADTYDLSFDAPPGVSLIVPLNPLALAPGERKSVFVTLGVKADAVAGALNVGLTASSQNSPGLSDRAQVTFTVLALGGVDVRAPSRQLARAGDTVVFHFSVVNQGNGLDRFALTARSSQRFELSIDPQELTLLPQEERGVSVTVHVAGQVSPGEDFITLSVQSQLFQEVLGSAAARLSIVPPDFDQVSQILFLQLPASASISLGFQGPQFKLTNSVLSVRTGGLLSEAFALDLGFSFKDFLAKTTFSLDTLVISIDLRGRQQTRLPQRVAAGGSGVTLVFRTLQGDVSVSPSADALSLNFSGNDLLGLPQSFGFVARRAGTGGLSVNYSLSPSFDLDEQTHLSSGLRMGANVSRVGNSGTFSLNAALRSGDAFFVSSSVNRSGPGAGDAFNNTFAAGLTLDKLTTRAVLRRSEDNIANDPLKPTVVRRALIVDVEARLGDFRLSQGITLSNFDSFGLGFDFVATHTLDATTRLRLNLGAVRLFSEFRFSKETDQVTLSELSFSSLNAGLRFNTPLVGGQLSVSKANSNSPANLALALQFSGFPLGVSSTLDVGNPSSVEVSLRTGFSFQAPIPFVKIKGQVEGRAFVDDNRNGVKDEGEEGVSGLTFKLASAQDPSLVFAEAFTNASGRYRFPPIAPGRYTIVATGMSTDLTIDASSHAVTLGKGQVVRVPILLHRVSVLRGSVFDDKNQNGVREADEVGFADVRFDITDGPSGNLSIFGNAEGTFALPLEPGGYTVRLDRSSLPPRFETTTPDAVQIDVVLGAPNTVIFGVFKRPRSVVITTFGALKARFTFKPLRPQVGQQVDFDATRSAAPKGGSIVSYGWNFGDGAHLEGPKPKHHYSQAGAYKVTLTVRDSSGKQDTVTQTIKVVAR